jgi:hypothetical protein
MIRYDTGDVIELTGACESTGEPGFEFLGRAGTVVLARDGNRTYPLLSPVVVDEVLDRYPDVGFVPYAFAAGLGVPGGVGFQRWQLSRPEPDRIRLDIELRWSPGLHPTGDLAERIRNDLFACVPVLGDAVGSGEVALELVFHEPGSTSFQALV